VEDFFTPSEWDLYATDVAGFAAFFNAKESGGKKRALSSAESGFVRCSNIRDWHL
jgi:hypothetical protein